jgi:uncharacterized phiE125 gp8 family phage protein
VRVISTQTGQEPITLPDLKLFLRVDGDADDKFIDECLRGARSAAENHTRRHIVRHSVIGFLEDWPSEPVALPHPPLVSVDTVQYIDVDGNLQTLSTDDYRMITGDIVARIAFDEEMPERKENSDIVINYQTGYTNPQDIPPVLVMGIRQAAAHMYELRQPVIIGSISASVPMSVQWAFDQEQVPSLA